MPGGRPPAIDKILTHDREGNPVTVGEQIVRSIRAGNYFEQACESAGVGRTTGYRWLRQGALTLRKIETKSRAKITANDRRYMEFWRAVTEADAVWEVGSVTLLEQLARGGLTKTVRTVKYDKDGNEVESTERIETLPPDPTVIMWRLERRHPDRYGRRVEVVESGLTDPLTRQDRVIGIAEQIEAWMEARETSGDADDASTSS